MLVIAKKNGQLAGGIDEKEQTKCLIIIIIIMVMIVILVERMREQIVDKTEKKRKGQSNEEHLSHILLYYIPKENQRNMLFGMFVMIDLITYSRNDRIKGLSKKIEEEQTK